ncbi:NADH-quinone oxidoreductase subunit C [bacterium]|nr:NADH-quinone oxidoreductase subunit C [bacterium]
MIADEIVNKLNDRFTDLGLECKVDKGHAVAIVPVDNLAGLLKSLKTEDELGFNFFMDITAVDWQEREPRFEVVYHLYSTEHNHRLRIKTNVKEGQDVPTSTGLWSIADWMEREVWDMYGIRFSGHPNMKRLLLYEEFKGHPLRKDYPYDKQQPLVEPTWPVRETQAKMDDVKIHRP